MVLPPWHALSVFQNWSVWEGTILKVAISMTRFHSAISASFGLSLQFLAASAATGYVLSYLWCCPSSLSQRFPFHTAALACRLLLLWGAPQSWVLTPLVICCLCFSSGSFRSSVASYCASCWRYSEAETVGFLWVWGQFRPLRKTLCPWWRRWCQYRWWSF